MMIELTQAISRYAIDYATPLRCHIRHCFQVSLLLATLLRWCRHWYWLRHWLAFHWYIIDYYYADYCFLSAPLPPFHYFHAFAISRDDRPLHAFAAASLLRHSQAGQPAAAIFGWLASHWRIFTPPYFDTPPRHAVLAAYADSCHDFRPAHISPPPARLRQKAFMLAFATLTPLAYARLFSFQLSAFISWSWLVSFQLLLD